MDNLVFEVVSPGLQTMVQDLGRYGYQKYGIVVSGAMDSYAFKMGNILVGNAEHAAGLEMTMIGPSLLVKMDCVVAITGANLSPTVNGEQVPMWTSLKVSKGSLIEFGPLKSGCRAYLTVNGGIAVPTVMGSKSTYLRANIGGYKGRALKVKDLLYRGNDDLISPYKFSWRRKLAPEYIPIYTNNIRLRVIKGPQWDAFTPESKEQFLTTTYTISSQSDRMGYRLSGEGLEVAENQEHITDPIPLGGIQVPAGGQPIVLLADRQTTGGYPKIATVISTDIPFIAQGKPGDRISFDLIELEDSHRLLLEQSRIIKSLLSFHLR